MSPFTSIPKVLEHFPLNFSTCLRPIGLSPVSGNFGTNDWLVEEMYEKYIKDPNSVEASWQEFFKSPAFTSSNFAPSAATSHATLAQHSSSPANSSTLSNGSPTQTTVTRPGTPPVPKSVARASQGVETQAPKVEASTAAPSTPTATSTQSFTPQPTVSQPRVSAAPTPAEPILKPVQQVATPSAARVEPIRGVGARVVASMEASLTVPTATSVRAIPAKLLIDNRTVINNHMKRARGGKVSFTHLIGYAMVKALGEMPEMNAFFTEIDGKPGLGHPEHINLGIAIDIAKADGTRQLLVPSIKGCEGMDFAQFYSGYEAMVKKAREGSLAVEDFAGTTVSLTNPGTIGTVHSVPRLVQGQGLILGVGSMDYPAEFQGASEETLARMAISKVVTLTSTYDHRIIQGAQSGDFLRRIHEILLGADGFYDEIFAALRIPYVPIRWVADLEFSK
ncbi:MAG: 2-oxoglutarate dehydrogenase component, partial [Actinomycetota bacterium]